MKSAKEEAVKAIAISIVVIWTSAFVAFLLIRPLYNSYVDALHPMAPVPFFILSPWEPFIAAAIMTALFQVHWWLSGLFGRAGIIDRPIANAMLVVAGLGMLLILFEDGAQDFYGRSLFCDSDDPTVVILLDEVHRCDLAMRVRYAASWVVLSLPLLAIPVRILESRFRARRA